MRAFIRQTNHPQTGIALSTGAEKLGQRSTLHKADEKRNNVFLVNNRCWLTSGEEETVLTMHSKTSLPIRQGLIPQQGRRNEVSMARVEIFTELKIARILSLQAAALVTRLGLWKGA